MAHPQLYPLRVNPKTREPYLQLPSPHENIIITPPRLSDVPEIVKNLNDFSVYKWLSGPPYPYLDSHADEWLASLRSDCDMLLEELELAAKKDPEASPIIVGGCPVRTLREVRADGTEVFLGDIGVDRCGYPDLEASFEKERLIEKNSQRLAGDPEIAWCIGYYLAASHHGRGIMTAALRTLISEWMIPRMGAHLIRAEAFKGNAGSRKVFEKNGFILEKIVDFTRTTQNGQTQQGMYVLLWRS